MPIFYQKYIDCAKEHSDYYVNTPIVSILKTALPQSIFFEWADGIDPKRTFVEFSRYDSIRPYQEYRTLTTRGSLGTQTKYYNGELSGLGHQIQVPCDARNFRIRFGESTVSKNIKVVPNNKYFIDNDGRVYQLYE